MSELEPLLPYHLTRNKPESSVRMGSHKSLSTTDRSKVLKRTLKGCLTTSSRLRVSMGRPLVPIPQRPSPRGPLQIWKSYPRSTAIRRRIPVRGISRLIWRWSHRRMARTMTTPQSERERPKLRILRNNCKNWGSRLPWSVSLRSKFCFPSLHWTITKATRNNNKKKWCDHSNSRARTALSRIFSTRMTFKIRARPQGIWSSSQTSLSWAIQMRMQSPTSCPWWRNPTRQQTRAARRRSNCQKKKHIRRPRKRKLSQWARDLKMREESTTISQSVQVKCRNCLSRRARQLRRTSPIWMRSLVVRGILTCLRMRMVRTKPKCHLFICLSLYYKKGNRPQLYLRIYRARTLVGRLVRTANNRDKMAPSTSRKDSEGWSRDSISASLAWALTIAIVLQRWSWVPLTLRSRCLTSRSLMIRSLGKI